MTILDTRRAKINGLFPVKVQVVFRRKQKYYSTGKELSKEDWDRLLKAKSQLLMEVRTDIESSFSIIKQQVSELIQKGEFSFEILSIRLGRHTKEINLRTAFELKMKELEDNEQASTYLNYRSALKSLECFGGTNIPLDRITVEWLKHCERFVEACHKLDEVEYYLDILTSGNSYERSEVIHQQMADGKLDELRQRLEKIHKEELEDGYDTADVA